MAGHIYSLAHGRCCSQIKCYIFKVPFNGIPHSRVPQSPVIILREGVKSIFVELGFHCKYSMQTNVEKFMSITRPGIVSNHDDVIKWKHIPRNWPLCGEFTGPGEFPTQRPVTRSFDVFFDLRLNKRLSKQPWGWWFETPAWSLWRHRNVVSIMLRTRMWRGWNDKTFHDASQNGSQTERLRLLIKYNDTHHDLSRCNI